MFTFDLNPVIIMWECKTECGKSPDGLSRRYAKRLSCSSYLSQRLEIAKGLLFHAGPLSPMSFQPLCLYCSLISASSSSPCKFLPCFNLEYSTCHPGVQDGCFPMIPVWLFVFPPHICPANQWKCDQKVQRHKGSGQTQRYSISARHRGIGCQFEQYITPIILFCLLYKT